MFDSKKDSLIVFFFCVQIFILENLFVLKETLKLDFGCSLFKLCFVFFPLQLRHEWSQ